MELYGEAKGLYEAAEDWIGWCDTLDCNISPESKQILRNFMKEVQLYITSKAYDNGDFSW